MPASSISNMPPTTIESGDTPLLSDGAVNDVRYSQVALDMLRRQLVSQVGEDLTRSIVAQAGRDTGTDDARRLRRERHALAVEDALELQYKYLTASGFGHFELVGSSVEGEQAYVHVRSTDSLEAASHRRLFGQSERPACWHLVGYSTGWATETTQLRLLTVESRCRAQGDDCCEFETLPYEDFVGPEAAFWKRILESDSRSMAAQLLEELHTKSQKIREQESTLEELSAPVLQVADDILVLPAIGPLDVVRINVMTEKLLAEVVQRRTRGVILDITGATGLDASMVHLVLQMARAVALLGAEFAMTGVTPTAAVLLATSDLDRAGFITCQTLQDGIRQLSTQLGTPRLF